MNIQQAQDFIKNIFESPFDKEHFTQFVKNLLNHMEDAPLRYQGRYIPEKFRQHVKTLERIGKYSDGEHTLDILVITLQKQASLERARTMQRNFIAWYLNGSRPGGGLKDAALVAYISPEHDDWRFSLVKMDYKFEKTASGKVKIKEEFTPARRWSFLVGISEKSHTAQSRLLKILAGEEHDPTLEELEDAFNIETVTKEFFLKYRDLFIRTKEALDEIVEGNTKVKADFEAKGVDTVNFAKKLLGQIIFLYFLQKKGWFGVGRDDDWGTGSRHFLRELFEGRQVGYDNFFNDILEPLFYEALRIDRRHDDDYYSRFNCKIPFLNGGLFDPIGGYDWVHVDIHLPNELFSNTQITKEGDTGDGILDVFDRYNFTVREDEPLEKEVAIDPELLGKAYEKFNAIRLDNFDEFVKALKSGRTGEENKFNKKFGVYYTPREIVHYMCQQSLINYLHNCAQESNLDIPVAKQHIETLIEEGELFTEHEAIAIVKEQNIENGIQKSAKCKPNLPGGISNNAKALDDWLANITVCDPAVGSGAFPVGMMNEIVRARNVLSVFLKEEDRSDYIFKSRCIENSLYGVDIDPGAVEIAKLRLWLSLVVDEEDIKNIKPLPNLDYKVVCGNSLIGLPKGVHKTRGVIEIQTLTKQFFSETNPSKKNELKREIDDKIYSFLSATEKNLGYHVDFDFRIYFSEVFHKKDGFDVIIANPPYVDSETMSVTNSIFRERLKKLYITAKGNWDLFVVFVEQGIKTVRPKGHLIYILPNKLVSAKYAIELRKYIARHSPIEFRDYSHLDVFQEADVYPVTISIQRSDRCSPGVSVIVMKNINEIEHQTTVPSYVFKSDEDWGKYFQEKKVVDLLIKISQFNKLSDSYGPILGAATVGEAYKIKEILHDSPTHQGKRFVNTGTIDPYCSLWGIRDTTYIKNRYRYPVVSVKDLTNVSMTRANQANATKIIISGMSKQVEAFLDEGNYLAGKSTTIVLGKYKDLKYLLCILNSSVITFFINNYYHTLKMAGGYISIGTNVISSLPIPNIFNEHYSILDEVLDRILSLKRVDPLADICSLEREIDRVVYKIYGLTDEEISIVEDERR